MVTVVVVVAVASLTRNNYGVLWHNCTACGRGGLVLDTPNRHFATRCSHSCNRTVARCLYVCGGISKQREVLLFYRVSCCSSHVRAT